MKGIATIAVFVLMIVACAVYVSAQQPDTTTKEYQKAREAYERLLAKYQSGDNPYVVGNGVRAPVTTVTLCTGPIKAEGGIPKCQAVPTVSGTLRIVMQDGTVQEIDLAKVKGMTVQ